MKVIKNIYDDGKAPSPKSGLSLAIYRTIDALSGKVTEDEILALLPAEIDDARMIGRKRIHNVMLYMKNWGYVVHEPGSDTWRIAPISYYNARQAHIEQLRREREDKPSRRRRSGERLRGVTQVVYRWDWRYGSLLVVVAFVAGVVVGGLL